jgi:hypothetical protein
MQQKLPANRPGRWLAGLGLVLLTTLSAQAQLTGTKTIPGSYATLAAAITDLNAQGVGAGGVTFNIAGGQPAHHGGRGHQHHPRWGD